MVASIVEMTSWRTRQLERLASIIQVTDLPANIAGGRRQQVIDAAKQQFIAGFASMRPEQLDAVLGMVGTPALTTINLSTQPTISSRNGNLNDRYFGFYTPSAGEVNVACGMVYADGSLRMDGKRGVLMRPDVLETLEHELFHGIGQSMKLDNTPELQKKRLADRVHHDIMRETVEVLRFKDRGSWWKGQIIFDEPSLARLDKKYNELKNANPSLNLPETLEEYISSKSAPSASKGNYMEQYMSQVKGAYSKEKGYYLEHFSRDLSHVDQNITRVENRKVYSGYPNQEAFARYRDLSAGGSPAVSFLVPHLEEHFEEKVWPQIQASNDNIAGYDVPRTRITPQQVATQPPAVNQPVPVDSQPSVKPTDLSATSPQIITTPPTTQSSAAPQTASAPSPTAPVAAPRENPALEKKIDDRLTAIRDADAKAQAARLTFEREVEKNATLHKKLLEAQKNNSALNDAQYAERQRLDDRAFDARTREQKLITEYLATERKLAELRIEQATDLGKLFHETGKTHERAEIEFAETYKTKDSATAEWTKEQVRQNRQMIGGERLDKVNNLRESGVFGRIVNAPFEPLGLGVNANSTEGIKILEGNQKALEEIVALREKAAQKEAEARGNGRFGTAMDEINEGIKKQTEAQETQKATLATATKEAEAAKIKLGEAKEAVAEHQKKLDDALKKQVADFNLINNDQNIEGATARDTDAFKNGHKEARAFLDEEKKLVKAVEAATTELEAANNKKQAANDAITAAEKEKAELDEKKDSLRKNIENLLQAQETQVKDAAEKFQKAEQKLEEANDKKTRLYAERDEVLRNDSSRTEIQAIESRVNDAHTAYSQALSERKAAKENHTKAEAALENMRTQVRAVDINSLNTSEADAQGKSGIGKRVVGATMHMAGRVGSALDNTHGRASAALGLGGAGAELANAILEGDTNKAMSAAGNLAFAGGMMAVTTETGQQAILKTTEKFVGERAASMLKKAGDTIVEKTTITTGKKVTEEVIETAVKTAAKEVAEEAVESGTKAVAKVAVKATVKTAAKAVPLLGPIVSFGFACWDAGSHFVKGEVGKGFAELAAGTAETVGGVIGTVVPIPGLGLVVGDALRQGVVEGVAYTTGVRASDASTVAMGKMTYNGVSYLTSSGKKEAPQPEAIQPPTETPKQVHYVSASAQLQSLNDYVAPTPEQEDKMKNARAAAQEQSGLMQFIAFILSLLGLSTNMEETKSATHPPAPSQPQAPENTIVQQRQPQIGIEALGNQAGLIAQSMTGVRTSGTTSSCTYGRGAVEQQTGARTA